MKFVIPEVCGNNGLFKNMFSVIIYETVVRMFCD